MYPISAESAVALAKAFESFTKGDEGQFAITYRDTEYKLVSVYNPRRTGPIVTLYITCTNDDTTPYKMAEVRNVNAMFTTDSLIISAGPMSMRIAFDTPYHPEIRRTTYPSNMPGTYPAPGPDGQVVEEWVDENVTG